MSTLVGMNIRMMRQALGWTMTRMADELAITTGEIVSANAIGAWQRGQRTVSTDTIVSLCQLFGCSAADLCDDSDSLAYRVNHTNLYLSMRWQGDAVPLEQMRRAYTMMPRHLRIRAAEAFMECWMQAVEEGSACEDLDVDTDKIVEGIRQLKKG